MEQAKPILELEYKPDFKACMDRVYAWYNHDIVDRVPVRFSAHNEEYAVADQNNGWKTLKDRWFDTEYVLHHFEENLKKRAFMGETFPVFWPNLGPNVYPCMIGGNAEFGDTTTWSEPVLKDVTEWNKLSFSRENEYFRKLDEMTRAALERCKGKYITGYTDIHAGADAADAVRGTTDLLMDMYDEPDEVEKLVKACSVDFKEVFHYFNDLLISNGQPSVTWMNIPSFTSMHIPSCDLSAMMSEEFFRQFALPYIKKEVLEAKHNVFHVDGKGVARHLDDLLDIDEICGYQWVQGMGDDTPIMQWVPLIKKIQDRKKGVVVDLKPEELDSFTREVNPLGIYLCISTHDAEEQQAIIKKLLKWK